MPVTDAVLTGGIWINRTSTLPQRSLNDVYVTPEKIAHQSFNFLLEREPQFKAYRAGNFNGNDIFSRPWAILDIGSGDGIFGKVARNIWPHSLIVGNEIRDIPVPNEYNRYVKCCITEWDQLYKKEMYDLVCGNPPYNLMNKCVEIGLEHLNENGFLLMLLPLTFITGVKRRDGLYSKHNLKYFGVFSKRISWYGGKTPPRDHALYLFQKGYKGPFTGYLLDNAQ